VQNLALKVPKPRALITFCAANSLADLIAPARDDKTPNVILPTTQKELEKYVDPSLFLVSSVFCLFESAQIANTFRLSDATGTDFTSGAAADFMNKVSNYFGR
jgi:hypothetical protein